MPAQLKLSDRLNIGPTVLKVRDLERTLGFYRDKLGLLVNSKGHDPLDDLEYLELGFKENFSKSGDPLLILKNDPEAEEAPRDSAGLYHFAILVPDRKSLAQAYLGIQRNHLQFDGFGDHLVSESLYLHDPEGNGIEIYRDRPRNEWARDKDGHIMMDTLPLDLDGILAELSQENEKASDIFPNGARIGHMHLRVTNLQRSLEFYHKDLGFDIIADLSSMGAMFLSTGGYHHHIGLNTWHSLNGKHHETREAGLNEFTIEVPRDDLLMHQLESHLESAILTRIGENKLLISDPDGIRILVKRV